MVCVHTEIGHTNIPLYVIPYKKQKQKDSKTKFIYLHFGVYLSFSFKTNIITTVVCSNWIRVKVKEYIEYYWNEFEEYKTCEKDRFPNEERSILKIDEKKTLLRNTV